MVPDSDEGTKRVKGASSTGQEVRPVVVMQDPDIVGTLALQWEGKGHVVRREQVFDLPFTFVVPQSQKGSLNQEKRKREWDREDEDLGESS